MGTAETDDAAAAAADAAPAEPEKLPATPAAPLTASALPTDGHEPSLIFVIIEQYEGDEQDGLPHGEGKARFAGRHKYEGGFSAGRMHGSGTYTWADGVVYAGSFDQNDVTGEGTYTWPDGSSYTGAVLKGKRHGEGVFTCADGGVTYSGGWQLGQRHGAGKLTYSDSPLSYYDGQWENDVKCGEGTQIYPSGNKYSGGWENNVKHGRGSMVWQKARQRYEGDWHEGQMQGTGEYTWASDFADASPFQMFNHYFGEWSAGKRAGEGVFYYATGAVYAGGWQNDMKHGWGLYTGEDGTRVSGQFEVDRLIAPDPSEADSGAGAPPHLSLDVASYIVEAVELMDPDETVDDERVRKEIRDVLHVFLRANARLKEVYKYYAALGLDEAGAGDNAFSLSLSQARAFVEDCSLPSREHTLATMDEELLASWKKTHVPAPLHIADVNDPHEDGRRVIFREFAELIVRAACVKYAGQPIPKKLKPDVAGATIRQQSPESDVIVVPEDGAFEMDMEVEETMPTPADCVTRLLEDNIYPSAMKAPRPGSLRDATRTAEMVGTLDGMSSSTGILWEKCGGSAGAKGTVTIKTLLVLVKNAGVTGPLLSVDSCLETLVTAVFDGVEPGALLQDYLTCEIIISEFNTCLVALASLPQLTPVGAAYSAAALVQGFVENLVLGMRTSELTTKVTALQEQYAHYQPNTRLVLEGLSTLADAATEQPSTQYFAGADQTADYLGLLYAEDPGASAVTDLSPPVPEPEEEPEAEPEPEPEAEGEEAEAAQEEGEEESEPEPPPPPTPLPELLAGMESPPAPLLSQAIRLAGSSYRLKAAKVGQVSLVQVVDGSVLMGVVAQAAALAEEVRHVKWLLGDQAWDMTIVIDDGWEAPPPPPAAPEPTEGEEGGDEEGGEEEVAAEPEPAPPAPQGPKPGPAADLAAALEGMLGSDSPVAVQCTSAWVAPEAPEGEEESTPAAPAAMAMAIQASAAYSAEPPAEPEDEEAPAPPSPALVLLPCFDGACHAGQIGDFVASLADGAQLVTAAVPGATANRLVSVLQSRLVPSIATAVPGAMAAFSVPAVKAALEAGVTAPKCVVLELITRILQSGSEEEPVSVATVDYVGSPAGLSVEDALPTMASLRALVPPPAEMTEDEEALAALAEEIAACAADPDVAASIQSDLPVELIEAAEVRSSPTHTIAMTAHITMHYCAPTAIAHRPPLMICEISRLTNFPLPEFVFCVAGACGRGSSGRGCCCRGCCRSGRCC